MHFGTVAGLLYNLLTMDRHRSRTAVRNYSSHARRGRLRMYSRREQFSPSAFCTVLVACNSLTFGRVCGVLIGFCVGLLSVSAAGAQDLPKQDETVPSVNRGVLVELPLPITSRVADSVIEILRTVAQSNDPDGGSQSRTTVVLQYRTEDADGAATEFEHALKLARAITAPEFRSLRIVSFLDGAIKGHASLPILAGDVLVITPRASISDSTVSEPNEVADDTIVAAYLSIAARRGLFPPAVVEAMVRVKQELILSTTLDGKRRFASGEELLQQRRDGGGWQEDVWATPDLPLVLTSDRLRDARIASFSVDTLDEARNSLDLAALTPIAENLIGSEPLAKRLEVSGAISRDRVRRWELNIAKATDAGELNTIVVDIDSSGGDLDASLRLAGTLSSTQPPLQSAIGFVQGQSRGDAALIALACKPLYIKPDARIGGPGGQSIGSKEVQSVEEAIEQISIDTARPFALIRGLLDPTLRVYRYTNIKTGQVRYATEDELALGSDEPEEERKLWKRGDFIDLTQGLSAPEAIELGLAEGQAESMKDLTSLVGLEAVPESLVDRGFVHFIEWIGGMKGVSIFLLMVGMVALSMEAGAPGISIPGFVSLIAFSLYFWIQFLNGTAEWLEILAFVLGVFCIAIEVFILPGIGVFGVGGLCLLVLGVVLTSQTFVIPRNTFQYEQMTRSLWLIIAGAAAIVFGFVLLRLLVPQKMLFKHLAMEAPDGEMIDRAERLTDYEYLLGHRGVATTPLRPAGKAQFGDTVVQVVSDGSAIGKGDAITVIEVKGNRVVVSAMN